MKKPLPKFSSEDEERAFWAAHDSAEYIDWKKGKRTKFPKLKPSKQPGPRAPVFSSELEAFRKRK